MAGKTNKTTEEVKDASVGEKTIGTLSIEELMEEKALLTDKLAATTTELAAEKEKSDRLTQELKVAGEVTSALKKELQQKKSASKIDDGIPLGSRKFKLLFAIKHKNIDVTEDTLRNDEALLAELVEGKSGALQEIL